MKSLPMAPRRRRRALVAACVAAVSVTVLGQSIPNPSFETDAFATWPGYISGNKAITGWTGTPDNRVGLNPAGGSPFADNGAVPAGANVAFIQANVDDPSTPSRLSTTITGLAVGTGYKVTFRANARASNTPNVKVYIDNIPVLLPGGPDGFSTAAVGGTNPYWTVAFEFQAAAASQELAVVNDADGDQTLLVDDFQIAPTDGRWAYAAWTGDADADADAKYFYTHAYNFGSNEGTTINGVVFTGVGGGNPSATGRFTTMLLGNLYGGDVNNITLAGEGSAILARDFVYGGNVPAGLYQSITLQGLTPGTEYIASLYTLGWEDPGVGVRWATFSAGSDALTINQDAFYNDNGMRISYRYVADASGTVTLRFAPMVPANMSIHIYGFSNREAVSRDVRPVISAQPRNVTVSPDLPVVFSVAATGVPTPTYQWRFNGAPITGATEATYTLPAATPADAGTYDVVVSNRAGSVPSTPARLIVGIPMVNPSFEADTYDVWPGYVSGNFAITAWTAQGGHGLNPVSDGRSPFADNGAIPNGRQVALMQADGPLSQMVTGLTPGAQYYVHYYENARSGYALPGVEVKVAGTTVVPAHPVTPVGGANPYYDVSSEVFTAAGTEAELSFIKSTPQGGDATALIDSVAIVPVAAGTAPSISWQPVPLTVYVGEPASFRVLAQGSLPLTYQWKLNDNPITGATGPTYSIAKVRLADEGDYTVVVSNGAGSVTSTPARLALLEQITTLHNTGLDAGNAPLPAGAIDPHWTFRTNPDGGSPDMIVGEEAWPIGSAWSANDAISKWVGPRASLGAADIPGGDYLARTTFDLTGRDPKTVFITGRWMSDNNGTAVFLNGKAVNIPLSGAFNAWTAFTIASSDVEFLPGVNTLDFGWNNASAGPAGLRVEFTRTSARTLPGIAPSIATNPRGGDVVEGSTVQLSVTAGGTLPLTYQWRKNGVDLPGKTDQTLTLVNVTGADSGNYSVKVSNPWGDAVSTEAALCVCLRPIPGIYGTGVGANGALLSDGEVDPHYTLVASADGNFPGPNAVTVTNAWPIQAGVWLPNGPDSRWISANADQRADLTPSTSGNAEGDYTFSTSFNLTGYDLARVRITGSWAVDNSGVDIILNDTSLGLVNNAGFAGFTAFALGEGLVAGPNTLQFVVNNLPDATWGINPMGLRVDLKGYLYVPPATQPTLTIAAQGASVTVTWSPAGAGQELRSAPAITGPWTKVEGATSPYTTTASGAARFFRVVIP